MRLLILLVFLSLPLQTYAQEVWLMAGGWSYHVNRSYPYNESHDMVGVRGERWYVAHLKNSYHKDTFALGYTYPFKDWKWVEVGGHAALWTGYAHKGFKYGMPIASPYLTFKWDEFRVVLMSTYTVSTVHIEYKLN